MTRWQWDVIVALVRTVLNLGRHSIAITMRVEDETLFEEVLEREEEIK